MLVWYQFLSKTLMSHLLLTYFLLILGKSPISMHLYLQGEKDMMKYETARKLHKCVDKIRAQYQDDWKSKEMKIRQRAVALYFIDKVCTLCIYMA